MAEGNRAPADLSFWKLPVGWTASENEIFESALAQVPGNVTLESWLPVIASLLPAKTLQDVKEHYDRLIWDIHAIENDLVSLPDYSYDDCWCYWATDPALLSLDTHICGRVPVKPKSTKEGRKKPCPWTADEHRQFLRALEANEEGDWKSISRNFVPTRTPQQVASHAQKYYKRKRQPQDKKKRRSIHDTVL